MTNDEKATLIAEKIMGWEFDDDSGVYRSLEDSGIAVDHEWRWVTKLGLGLDGRGSDLVAFDPCDNVGHAMMALERVCKDRDLDFHVWPTISLASGVDRGTSVRLSPRSWIGHSSTAAAAITEAIIQLITR